LHSSAAARGFRSTPDGSGCAITLSYNLNRPSGEDWLYGRESVGVFLDTDGNAGTGEAGFDRALITIGDSYGTEHSQLASWNGTDWVTQNMPAIPGSGGAQRLPFNTLGISAPTTVNVRAISNYSDPSGPDRDQFDFAPDEGAVGVRSRSPDRSPHRLPRLRQRSARSRRFAASSWPRQRRHCQPPAAAPR
jgi:hypothetical protein